MNTIRLFIRELWFSKLNALLTAGGLAAAVVVFIALVTLAGASQNETARLMRDMGHNMLVLPGTVDMANYYAGKGIVGLMPEDYVARLAESPVDADHYVGVLEHDWPVNGRSAVVTGVVRAMGRRARNNPLGYQVAPDTCFVGFTIARALGLSQGDTLTLGDKTLRVERALLEAGTRDDIRIWMHLHDAQALLGRPGQINKIEALGCICYGETIDDLRRQIAAILPDTYVTEMSAMAHARMEQRHLTEQFAAALLAIMLAGCIAWIALLGILNARQRRHEFGLMRALGAGSGRIGALVTIRAVVLGTVAAGAGFGLAWLVVSQTAPALFPLTAHTVRFDAALAIGALVAAPLAAALGGLAAALIALADDPADILSKEAA